MDLFDDNVMDFLTDSALGIFEIWIRSFIVAIKVTAFILLPFIFSCFLQPFVKTWFVNNLIFFIGGFIILLILKLINYRISNNFLIKFLFNTYISLFLIYILFYVFNLSNVEYAILKIIDNAHGLPDIMPMFKMSPQFNDFSTNNTCYTIVSTMLEKLTSFIKWNYNNVVGIDSSCFHVAAANINFISIIITCFKYLFVFLFAVLSSAGFAILLLGIVGATIYIPLILSFFMAWLVTFAINKLRYHKSTKPPFYLKRFYRRRENNS